MPTAWQDEVLTRRITLTPLFEETGIPLAVMGIVAVFLALALLVALISLLPRLVDLLAAKGHSEPVAGDVADPDEIPEETVVVIAAAVAVALGRPQRIVRIRGLTPADLGWSLEGRMEHHQSHRIEHRDR